MAIDATTIDTAAAAPGAVARAVPRERPPSPVISDGHNGRGVEIRGEMSFDDFLDVINPLQHLPIVGNIYRELTGDTIKTSSKVIGGILYGGVVGGMASITNAVVEEAQGKDLGDQVLAALGFGGGDAAPGATTEVAAKPEDTAVANALAAVQGSSAPAAVPQPTGSDRPVRLNASATPPASAHPMGAASAAALGLQAGAQAASAQRLAGGTPRDALGAVPGPSRMPTRDTPLANSMMAKHSAPRFAAPMPGSTLANAQSAPLQAGRAQGAKAQRADTAGAADSGAPKLEVQDGASPNVMTPVSPDMLSETMMRNLAKYEQSRRAAQSAAPSLRVSS
ncbi:hypothetical protein [Azospirillum rugosum]|uniref:Uncharacterized protein n=1 Tax=Azospirillum rugosum TaxID=416170 RepID=A0ABS4SMW1_9PROT|nr:hypothetical protein [Azospirillum rugosum]MBP2293898.1 hypothetical protein [Azospirillum rugosum]MDQ0526915.1 hypothetical protein [Azospirillum rugosum]